MSVTKVLSLTLFAGYLLSVGAPSVLGQDEAVQQRKKAMRALNDAMKQIKAGVGKKDYATIAAKAKFIADNLQMDSFAKLWPRDTTGGKSRARAEIWQKWDDFMAQTWDTKQKALALAAAAEAKDGAKVTEAAKAFAPRKSTQSCGDSCHRPYRASRRK